MKKKKLTKGEALKEKIRERPTELFEDLRVILKKHGLNARVERLTLAVDSNCSPPCKMVTRTFRDANGNNVTIRECLCPD